ncbi:actin cytoskeleton-regulatory complex protein PAN1 [Bombyx mandarina]|uniref:Actin cytoskeleton-regulatory complex protein PAN1 n=1 Tax=Bombyx mandarina TaxID=7092 RepID=A0A6J2KBE7_BOMMA|nr:actin cytoskeleton-regulatory complex protein PAN1 [Bombyx mandarina]
MEKEHQPDSMATITMKPEYPPSEVYSTSEPPPAYRHRVSTSVQIAKIAALTVVASSFILGTFILASSWVAARSSCHQLEQLDAMLDKELALEGRAYGNDALVADEPLPLANAHALHGVPPTLSSVLPETSQPSSSRPSLFKDDALNHAESKINEDKLQKIDDDKNDSPNSSDESPESDSSAEEDDELEAIRPMFKLPIQFDLDELAGAFLANNQKGRMNCVVERRNDDPMERRFPFNILGAFAPRSAHAERVAIICHGGDEPRAINFPEPQSQVFAFPLTGPVRLPLRPQPETPSGPEPRMPFGPGSDARMPPFAQAPEQRMPPFAQAPEQRMPPFAQAPEQRMPPFAPLGPMAPVSRQASFPLPMPWESSEEQTGGPREMRIHVQRVIAIPAPHNMPQAPEPDMGPFAPPPPPPQQDQNEQQTIVHQFVPQTAPTQEMEQPEGQKAQDGAPVQMSLPWGLTPADLHAIHRSAQHAIDQSRREQQMDNDMQEVKTIVNTLAAAAEAEAEAEAGAQEGPRAETPRAQRTLLLPQEQHDIDERPHYMQPRSVRSVDSMLEGGKRVKRCACKCA